MFCFFPLSSSNWFQVDGAQLGGKKGDLTYFGAQIRIRVTVESESDDSWWDVWPLSIKSNETMPTQSC